MKVLYFAWVRESIGVGEETVNLPSEVENVGDLLFWLGHDVLLDHSRLRAAIDGTFVTFDAPLRGAAEVAIFPPVTGG